MAISSITKNLRIFKDLYVKKVTKLTLPNRQRESSMQGP